MLRKIPDELGDVSSELRASDIFLASCSCKIETVVKE